MVSVHRPFGVEVVLRTSQAHRRELVQTLEGMVRPESAEGEAAISFFEDVTESNRFLWTEWWPRREDAEAAIASDRFRTLLAAVRVLGTLESLRRLELLQELPETSPAAPAPSRHRIDTEA